MSPKSKKLPAIPERFYAADIGADRYVRHAWAVFEAGSHRRVAVDLRAHDARRVARLLNIDAAWTEGLLVVRVADPGEGGE